jgi:membrane protease YdiL (CAAX protease family)
MARLRAFVVRHAVPIYFVVTFAVSWGGLLVVFGPAGIPQTKEQLRTLLPSAIPAMLAGPGLSGVMLTALVYGRAGLRDVLSRVLEWRAGAGWYVVALLGPPVVLTSVPVALSLKFAEFVPGILTSDRKVSVLLTGILAGVAVGILEELGWTGFATPRLRLRHGILSTGLIVGVAWGVWHIPPQAVLASGAYAGGLSAPLFVVARSLGLVAGLTPFRMLIVWVFDRTGSLPVAMLMHASLTAATLVVEPAAVSGRFLLIYDAVSAAAWWLVVAAVAISNGRQLSRRHTLGSRVA